MPGWHSGRVGPRRMVVVGVLAWSLVVVVVAGFSWLAIDRAGRQVLQAASLPGSGALAGADQTSDAGPGAGGQPTPRQPASPTKKARSAAAPTAKVSSPAPRASRGSTTTSRPGAGEPSSKETPRSRSPRPSTSERPGKSSSPPSASRTRTVSVSGGRVAVSCSGSRISLLYASPDQGWQVEVGDAGPEKVEVHFHQRAGGDRETEVSARCAGGSPQVSTGGEDGGDS